MSVISQVKKDVQFQEIPTLVGTPTMLAYPDSSIQYRAAGVAPVATPCQTFTTVRTTFSHPVSPRSSFIASHSTHLVCPTVPAYHSQRNAGKSTASKWQAHPKPASTDKSFHQGQISLTPIGPPSTTSLAANVVVIDPNCAAQVFTGANPGTLIASPSPTIVLTQSAPQATFRQEQTAFRNLPPGNMTFMSRSQQSVFPVVVNPCMDSANGQVTYCMFENPPPPAVPCVVSTAPNTFPQHQTYPVLTNLQAKPQHTQQYGQPSQHYNSRYSQQQAQPQAMRHQRYQQSPQLVMLNPERNSGVTHTVTSDGACIINTAVPGINAVQTISNQSVMMPAEHKETGENHQDSSGNEVVQALLQTVAAQNNEDLDPTVPQMNCASKSNNTTAQYINVVEPSIVHRDMSSETRDSTLRPASFSTPRNSNSFSKPSYSMTQYCREKRKGNSQRRSVASKPNLRKSSKAPIKTFTPVQSDWIAEQPLGNVHLVMGLAAGNITNKYSTIKCFESSEKSQGSPSESQSTDKANDQSNSDSQTSFDFTAEGEKMVSNLCSSITTKDEWNSPETNLLNANPTHMQESLTSRNGMYKNKQIESRDTSKSSTDEVLFEIKQQAAPDKSKSVVFEITTQDENPLQEIKPQEWSSKIEILRRGKKDSSFNSLSPEGVVSTNSIISTPSPDRPLNSENGEVPSENETFVPPLKLSDSSDSSDERPKEISDGSNKQESESDEDYDVTPMRGRSNGSFLNKPKNEPHRNLKSTSTQVDMEENTPYNSRTKFENLSSELVAKIAELMDRTKDVSVDRDEDDPRSFAHLIKQCSTEFQSILTKHGIGGTDEIMALFGKLMQYFSKPYSMHALFEVSSPKDFVIRELVTFFLFVAQGWKSLDVCFDMLKSMQAHFSDSDISSFFSAGHDWENASGKAVKAALQICRTMDEKISEERYNLVDQQNGIEHEDKVILASRVQEGTSYQFSSAQTQVLGKQISREVSSKPTVYPHQAGEVKEQTIRENPYRYRSRSPAHSSTNSDSGRYRRDSSSYQVPTYEMPSSVGGARNNTTGDSLAANAGNPYIHWNQRRFSDNQDTTYRSQSAAPRRSRNYYQKDNQRSKWTLQPGNSSTYHTYKSHADDQNFAHNTYSGTSIRPQRNKFSSTYGYEGSQRSRSSPSYLNKYSSGGGSSYGMSQRERSCDGRMVNRRQHQYPSSKVSLESIGERNENQTDYLMCGEDVNRQRVPKHTQVHVLSSDTKCDEKTAALMEQLGIKKPSQDRGSTLEYQSFPAQYNEEADISFSSRTIPAPETINFSTNNTGDSLNYNDQVPSWKQASDNVRQDSGRPASTRRHSYQESRNQGKFRDVKSWPRRTYYPKANTNQPHQYTSASYYSSDLNGFPRCQTCVERDDSDSIDDHQDTVYMKPGSYEVPKRQGPPVHLPVTSVNVTPSTSDLTTVLQIHDSSPQILKRDVQIQEGPPMEETDTGSQNVRLEDILRDESKQLSDSDRAWKLARSKSSSLVRRVSMSTTQLELDTEKVGENSSIVKEQTRYKDDKNSRESRDSKRASSERHNRSFKTDRWLIHTLNKVAKQQNEGKCDAAGKDTTGNEDATEEKGPLVITIHDSPDSSSIRQKCTPAAAKASKKTASGQKPNGERPQRQDATSAQEVSSTSSNRQQRHDKGGEAARSRSSSRKRKLHERSPNEGTSTDGRPTTPPSADARPQERKADLKNKGSWTIWYSTRRRRGLSHLAVVKLEEILNEMWNSEHSDFIKTSVDSHEVQDYYKIVKHPMFLDTIAYKLKNRIYETIEQYVHDFRRIFYNCKVYNKEGTIWLKYASTMEKEFQKLLEEQFGASPFPDITGNPAECNGNPALRYMAFQTTVGRSRRQKSDKAVDSKVGGADEQQND